MTNDSQKAGKCSCITCIPAIHGHIRRQHSSDEVGERARGAKRGVDGAKAVGRGKRGRGLARTGLQVFAPAKPPFRPSMDITVRASVSQGLDRVRERAKAQAKEKFTALLHHVDIDRLRDAYLATKRDVSPGIDGMTWEQYGERLEANLVQLHGDIHRGAYRALPSKREGAPVPVYGEPRCRCKHMKISSLK